MVGGGIALVLVGAGLLGSRPEPAPPYRIEAGEEGQVLTGIVEGAEVYRFTVPEGMQTVVEDVDVVTLEPGPDAPTPWGLTVGDLPVDVPLADLVDGEDLRERLPAYADGRELLTAPTPVDVAGEEGFLYEVRDTDGDPYVVRAVLVDRAARRYAIALAVPEADAEMFGPTLGDVVLGSWEWLD